MHCVLLDTRQPLAQFSLTAAYHRCGSVTPSPEEDADEDGDSAVMKATSLKMVISRVKIWVRARRPTQAIQGGLIPI